MFNVMLIRFKEEGHVKYKSFIENLVGPELSTLEVSFDDVERYNQGLATTIIEEYYRFVRSQLISKYTLTKSPTWAPI